MLEDSDSARSLIRAHTELTRSAYDSVYAELSAERLENQAVYGVPAEYDALLSVEAVYELRREPFPGCK